jgi:hypothetical protein
MNYCLHKVVSLDTDRQNAYEAYIIHVFSSQCMNTLQPAVEMWVDQGKDAETSTHQDRTCLDGLHAVAAAAAVGKAECAVHFNLHCTIFQ